MQYDAVCEDLRAFILMTEFECACSKQSCIEITHSAWPFTSGLLSARTTISSAMLPMIPSRSPARVKRSWSEIARFAAAIADGSVEPVSADFGVAAVAAFAPNAPRQRRIDPSACRLYTC